jgi:hypothetical protein
VSLRSARKPSTALFESILLTSDWGDAAVDRQSIAWMTPEELRALGERLTEAIPAIDERLEDPDLRPPGALPVELLLLAHPIAPPALEE